MIKQHHFDVEHAKAYGVDEAIVINAFQYWIMLNQSNGRHFHDGRTWTYNSISALSEMFEYWSEKQLRRIMKSLEKQNVLITGNYNETEYDRTTWYAFLDESIFLNRQIHLPKRSNGSDQMGKPIPIKNQLSKPDKRESAREENPKIELDYIAAQNEITAYLKENPTIAHDRMTRAGVPLTTAGKKTAIDALSGYLNKMAKAGEWYELTPPKDEGRFFQWIAKRLAGWEGFLRIWYQNEQKDRPKSGSRPAASPPVIKSNTYVKDPKNVVLKRMREQGYKHWTEVLRSKPDTAN